MALSCLGGREGHKEMMMLNEDIIMGFMLPQEDGVKAMTDY